MDFNADAANGIAMEGYLYKRASNAFKTWSRCKWTHQITFVGLILWYMFFLNIISLLQALVFNSKKSAGLSEEIQGISAKLDKCVREGVWENTDVACFHVSAQDQPTVVVEDLRLCTVKPSSENERRFCFEVVSPSKWVCVSVCAYLCSCEYYFHECVEESLQLYICFNPSWFLM